MARQYAQKDDQQHKKKGGDGDASDEEPESDYMDVDEADSLDEDGGDADDAAEIESFDEDVPDEELYELDAKALRKQTEKRAVKPAPVVEKDEELVEDDEMEVDANDGDKVQPFTFAAFGGDDVPPKKDKSKKQDVTKAAPSSSKFPSKPSSAKKPST